MKFLKVFAVLLLLILILAGGAFWYVLDNAGGLIKEAVETQGPKITGTTVALADANVSLGMDNSSTELDGLVIGNPDGFDTEHLFKLGRIYAQLDPSSLQNKVLVINEITIEGVDVQVEQKGTTTNVQTLLNNIEKNTGSASSSTEEEPADDSQEEETTTDSSESQPAIRYMIEKLVFAQGTVKLKSEQLGEKDLTLPKLELTNLGDKTTGLTPEQMTKAIIDPLLQNAQKAAEDELTGQVEGAVKDKVNEVLDSQTEGLDDETKSRLKGLLGE